MKGMIKQMETAALIIQGRDDYTASEPVEGTLPLLRIIRTFQYAGVKRIVVAGEEHLMSDAFRQATRLEAEFIYSSRTRRKVASYRANAIEYLRDKCDRLFVTPAYFPLFDVQTVKLITEKDAALAAPVYKGKRGHPVLISSEFFGAMFESDGDYEKLFAGNDWAKVEVNDEGVTADVTKPINTERIAGKLTLHNEVRPGFKLTLRREKSFYGPGIQELIRLIEETGSMKQAYILMGIAHSNARKIIKETEKGLGFKVFDNDGSNYGGTIVTEEAKAYAAKYKAFHEACEKSVDELYKRFFE